MKSKTTQNKDKENKACRLTRGNHIKQTNEEDGARDGPSFPLQPPQDWLCKDLLPENSENNYSEETKLFPSKETNSKSSLTSEKSKTI